MSVPVICSLLKVGDKVADLSLGLKKLPPLSVKHTKTMYVPAETVRWFHVATTTCLPTGG